MNIWLLPVGVGAVKVVPETPVPVNVPTSPELACGVAVTLAGVAVSVLV